jgi:hypothetical protein
MFCCSCLSGLTDKSSTLAASAEWRLAGDVTGGPVGGEHDHLSGQVVTVAGGMEGRVLHE